MIKRISILFMVCLLSFSISAQTIEVTGSRKAVRTSGDIGAVLLPVALKYAVKKERPDHSDFHSFPSMHTSVSFAAASFIQRRYGWKWGAPAYVLSTYVGWSRVYGKKHDWWDVAAGAVIGTASSYIFTRPFAKKHNLTISPVAGDGHYGVYASMNF